MSEHQEWVVKDLFTHKLRPVTFFFYEDFKDINQVIIFEKQVKGWSRKKKEELMEETGINSRYQQNAKMKAPIKTINNSSILKRITPKTLKKRMNLIA